MLKGKHVLYVLNAADGGASFGIYEAVKHLPKDSIVPYAIVPVGSSEQLAYIRSLFKDVEVCPLAWWNTVDTLDPLRRLGQEIGRLRRGITLRRNVEAIKACIQRWGIDIVHSGTSLTLSGALAAQELGIPHVWHIKETIGQQNRIHFPMSDAVLVEYMQRLSDKVVVMSEYIGSVFREHGCNDIFVLPDGVDLTLYQNKPLPRLRSQLNIQQGNYLVGMVASFVSVWKQHDLFIEMAAIVAKKNPHTYFVLIGRKPNPNAHWPYDIARRYYKQMEKLAEQKIEKNRWTFLSHHSNPAEIMASLDILVHPCSTEPFGRIAIEAMSSGIPIVGPNTGGIAEVVVKDQTGILVPANNVNAMAEAVLELLENPSKRANLGYGGREHANHRYGIKLHVKALLKLYDQVLINRLLVNK